MVLVLLIKMYGACTNHDYHQRVYAHNTVHDDKLLREGVNWIARPASIVLYKAIDY